MSQRTLEGELAGEKVLDMTSGLRGMQYEIRQLAEVNLDLSRFRAVNVRGSFAMLPFRDGAFEKVLFDPPHTLDSRNTLLGTMDAVGGYGPHVGAFKFGCYRTISQMRKSIWEGSKEAWRVLEKDGTLIFKWSDSEKPWSWGHDTVRQAASWKLERLKINGSGANTGNSTFYGWYRKR